MKCLACPEDVRAQRSWSRAQQKSPLEGRLGKGVKGQRQTIRISFSRQAGEATATGSEDGLKRARREARNPFDLTKGYGHSRDHGIEKAGRGLRSI